MRETSRNRATMWVLAVACVLLAGGPARSQESSGGGAKDEDKEQPSAKEVLDKLDDLYRSSSSHATLEMEVKKPRGTRKLTLESWTKGEEQALVVIRKPAREAGTATLRTPDGLWNYAPRADRLIRIPSGLLSDNWMGSHFTNDDLMRETSYDEDYNGQITPTQLDGEAVWELTLEPKPDAPVVYSKLVMYVTRSGWLPRKVDYYDEGEVVRTMTYTKVEKIGGRRLPTVMTLRPADAEGERTRVTYEELEFGVKIKARMFSKRGLRRVAR